MPDDLEQLTPAEAEYFQSAGDASAYLDEQADIADEQAEQQQPAEPAPRSPADFGGRTIHVENGRLPSESEQRLREELHQERLARQQDQLAHARTGERLNMLSEVTAPPQQLPDAVQVEQPINPEQDIFGWAKQRDAQWQQLARSAIDHHTEQQWQNRYAQDAARVAQLDPGYPALYQHNMRTRAVELLSQRYPNATPQRLARMPVPADIQQQIKDEERSFAEDRYSRGENPHVGWYRQGVIRGFRTTKMKQMAAEQQRKVEAEQRKVEAKAKEVAEIARAEHARRMAVWDDRKREDYMFSARTRDHWHWFRDHEPGPPPELPPSFTRIWS